MDRRELASLWGVQTRYRDYRKEPRTVPDASVDAVLEVLGAGPSGPPPPMATIVRPGGRVDLSRVEEIVTEDGGSVAPHRGGLPPGLPFGYHRAVAPDGSERPLILSPGVCHLPSGLNVWGWALQLYALRSERSWGIGDLRDLRDFASWAADLGADAVMLNPLHAPLPVSGQQPSPYFPSSRCFRNPLYLALDDIEGVDLERSHLAERHELNTAPLVDRDAIYRSKMEVLRKTWAETTEAGRGIDESDGLLWDYATFAAIAEEHEGGPRGWPTQLADGDARAVREWAEEHSDRIRFHAWLQRLLDEQLARAGGGIGLVNDLAIGVDPQGADAWLWRDLFASGVTVGAPPDEFNLRGQGWGLPPFDPWKLRAAGYEPFIQTIRSGFRHSAGMRIDHVMGLFRLFWIPEGMAPSEGTYVRYPAEDLLNIVALESHRARAFVVGEDLGTVEDHVRDEMLARNMLSYRLLWFEDDKPESYPEVALAAVANHDVPTIAGLWNGSDIEAQREAGLEVNVEGIDAQLERLRRWLDLEPGAALDEVILAIYSLLADAPSAVIMATLEDVLGVEERPNMPGTMDERPNWSIPLPVTLEELKNHPAVLAVAGMLSERRA